MSGSGPGNGGPGEWIPQNSDACETLTQQLALNSPNPSVLKLLKPNDLLEVRSQKINGAAIVEALYQGSVAGTIRASHVQLYIEMARPLRIHCKRRRFSESGISDIPAMKRQFQHQPTKWGWGGNEAVAIQRPLGIMD
jgi:hypothetical protein